jgi:hypothetical protein
MRTHRRYDRPDKNQSEIIVALRSVGAKVVDTSVVGGGFPDLVCKFRGTLYLMEVKSKKGRLTPREYDFFEDWGDVTIIVRNPEDALKAIGAM